MKNLSKYITLNLLSILGYIFLIFLLVVEFYLFPEMKEYARVYDNDFNAFAEKFVLITSVSLIYTLIEFFLILFVFPIEKLIYTLKKIQPEIIKIPNKFRKIHTILFCVGIVFALIPFGFLILMFFY